MMAAVLIVFAGPPCSGFFTPTFCRSGYCPPVAVAPYTPPVVIADAYVEPIRVVDRVSFAVFEVGNGQQQSMLATLNQQSRTLDAAFRSSEARAARLEAILSQQAVPLTATPRAPPPPRPTPAVELPADVAAGRQAGAAVLVNRCSSCHAGEIGRQNKWVLDPKELANPDWRLRVRVQRFVFHPEPSKRMPQGGKLTEQESQAVLAWGQFSDVELVGSSSVAQNGSK